jgi:hypothetical protein
VFDGEAFVGSGMGEYAIWEAIDFASTVIRSHVTALFWLCR